MRKKKILSIFLTFLMFITMFPVSINADDLDTLDETSINQEEKQTYYCNKDEHIHDDRCYENIYVLDCNLNHKHEINCYKQIEFLLCDKVEHAHDDSCLKNQSGEGYSNTVNVDDEHLEVFCDQEEHTHDLTCYKKTDNKILICDLDHIHNDDCAAYEYKLDCDIEEHKHNDRCYLDDTDWLEEEIIEPDIIETVERSPIALMRAPLRANDNVDELEIRTFITQFFYGASLTDGDYVWNAPSSASGHRFSFRINYAISGKFELAPNSIEMRIPKSILKDRDGNYADTYEMSIPTKREVDDGEEIDMDINYAYYEDGDDIVIYNFREVYTGENGYIEMSYFTSKSTYNYYDYKHEQSGSDDFYATIEVTGNDKTVTAESQHYKVHINTNATIQSTDKRFPYKYDEWDVKWGNKPDDADEYVYLLWEVKTIINPDTQPYNFILKDLGILEPAQGEVVAIKPNGQTTFISGDEVNVTSSQASGTRYDMVLTRHTKSWWNSQGDHVEIKNAVSATVDPVDQIDPDTTANSTATYVWNRPQFIHPMGWYDSYKRADRSYNSRNGLDYLGMKAAEYSRYDLETMQDSDESDPKVQYLDNMDYAVWYEGYPYLHTAIDFDNPETYWQIPVKYELYDYIFYLYDEADGVDEPNVGTNDETYGIPKQEYIDNRLTYEDFQIDSLAFGTDGYQDARFNENSLSFSAKSVTYKADEGYGVTSDILYFYAMFGSNNDPTIEENWKLVATYNLEKKEKWYDSSYVTNMTNNRIYFVDNCVAYKNVTYSKHFHSRIDLVPNIRLKRSDKVAAIIDNADAVGILNSETANWYPYDSNTDSFDTRFMTRSESASDYLRRSKRSSYISKSITATSNVVRRKRYIINWSINMQELYQAGQDGQQIPIEQSSGTFYDILPAGSVVNVDSIAVANQSGYLLDGDYSYEVIDNYNNSGKTLLIVHIYEPGERYRLYYETAHPWDSIKDWGNDVYNPVAFETGNDDISPFNDAGDRESDPDKIKNQFLDIVNNSQENKFIYADTAYDISILTAAAANLHKKVKDSTDEDYSYDTWTTTDGNYSYRWRYQNTFNTKAKDLIFFDYMEQYPVLQDDNVTTKSSDWYGIFESIDLSQLISKGIEPVVYYSTRDDLIQSEHHDLTDTSVWSLLTDSVDKETIKALAVDARKTNEGSDFILLEGDSVSVIVHMKAPSGVEFTSTENQKYPESYNNIYLENTTIDENGGSAHFFIHQDYTTIRLAVTQDIRILKLNEENQNQVIPDIKFRLYGKSDYGTEYDLITSTDRNGRILFKNIEMGNYILQEFESNEDWIEDHTEYHINIDKDRVLRIDGIVKNALEYYVITNKPRIHGDLIIQKRREGTSSSQKDIISEIKSKSIGDIVNIEGINYSIVEKNNFKAKLHQESFLDQAYGVYDSSDYSFTFFRDENNKYYNNQVEGTKTYFTDFEDRLFSNYRDVPWADKNIKCKNVIFKDLIQPLDTSYWFSEWGIVAYVEWNSNTNNYEYELNFDFTNLDTSKTEAMSSMFGGANLVRLPKSMNLNTFDTSSLKRMDYMFYDGEYLETLDLSSFDTKKVMNMRGSFAMFNIKDIYVSELWNTNNVSNSDFMFQGSTNLPNYTDYNWDKTYAHYGDGGYLKYKQYNRPELMPGEIWYSLEEKPQNPISDTTFKLSGLSDYGNEIIKVLTSDVSGRIVFENIEKGTYELVEIKENDNFVINKTKWTVIVDDSGNVSLIEPTNENDKDRLYEIEQNGLAYNIYNEPRYWGFSLLKIDKQNNTILLEGAKFSLTGISDLDTEYNLVAESNSNGKVVFDGIEKGTYVLKEIEAPTNLDENGNKGGNRNYYSDGKEYIVSIDYSGNVEIQGLNKNDDGDFIVENDRANDGEIIVIKKWVDGKTGEDASNRPKPVLHLTTKGVNVRTLEITKVWNDDNSNRPNNITIYIGKDGTDNIISQSNTWFKNNDVWVTNIDIEFDDNSTYYVWEDNIEDYESNATIDNPVEIINNKATILNSYITNSEEEITSINSGTKYAVQLYGIGEDTNKDNKTMGLTFGPAIWGSYVRDHKQHNATGFTEDGNAHRCIHDDDWDTIISWNNTDPYVYEQCIKENCTHSIILDLPDILRNDLVEKNRDPLADLSTSDGSGMLKLALYTIHQTNEAHWANYNEYLENILWNGQDIYEDGYGKSRIRAILNGYDSDISDGVTTDSSIANTNYNIIPVESYTINDSIYGAFPDNLKNAIGYKKIDYTGKNRNANLVKSVYDKLWLFSASEVTKEDKYSSDYYKNAFYNPYEGNVYSKFILNDIYLSQGNSLLLSTRDSKNGGVYTDGTLILRTVSNQDYDCTPIKVTRTGTMGNITTSNQDGIAFGFALDTNYFENHNVHPIISNNALNNTLYLTTSKSKNNNYSIIKRIIAEDYIATGNAHGANWRLTSDGLLQIGTENSVEHINYTYYGEIGNADWSWNEYNDQIKKIEFVGKVIVDLSAYKMFYDSKASTIDLTNLDTSNATSFISMFEDSLASNIIGLENLNTSSVSSMKNMFKNSNIKSVNVTNWNTQRVNDMSYMFNAPIREIIGISNFNTRLVTNMSNMFQYVVADELDLSNFDTSRVTTMNSMFKDCYSNIVGLDNFDTSSLYGDGVVSMFQNCGSENIDIRNFDLSNVTSTKEMFKDCIAQQILLPTTTGKVTTMEGMFDGCMTKTLDVSVLDTSKVTNMSYMFAVAGIENLIGFETLNTSNVTNIVGLFGKRNSSASKDSNQMTKIINLSNFDFSKISSMRDMFYSSCAEKIIWPDNLDTSNVTSMESMFRSTKMDNIDISMLDTSNVKSMNLMFYNSDTNSINISGIDTSKVTDMTQMFGYAKAKNVDGLNKIDTRNVTKMNNMFSYSEIINLDLSNFNTNKLTDTFRMFEGSKANVIDLSSFDMSKVSSYDYFLKDANFEKITFSSGMKNNHNRYLSNSYFPEGDWVRIRDQYGNLTHDETSYTADEIKTLTEETNPKVSGTWVKKNSNYYNQIGDTQDTEYVSDEEKWIVLDDGSWMYKFNVFDDTLKYYLYEEYLDGYTSDVIYPSYTIVNDGEITKSAEIVNTSNNEVSSISLSKKIISGKQYIYDENNNIVYVDDDSIIPNSEYDRAFIFIIKLQGSDISGLQIFDGIVFNDGVANIQLKDNDTKVINGLPLNTTYEVIEVIPTQYESNIENSSGDLSYLGQVYENVTKYSYTENLDSNGNIITKYGNNWGNANIIGSDRGDLNQAHVVTIPGAESLKITMKYSLEYGYYSPYDYFCIWEGSHPEYTARNNYSSSLLGRISSYSNNHEIVVQSDTVTFSFYSDSSGQSSTGLGYYAIIEGYGLVDKTIAINPEVNATNVYHERKEKSGKLVLNKNVIGNSIDSNEFDFVVLFTDLNPSTTYYYSNNNSFISDSIGNATLRLKLANNDSYVFDDLPVGTTYQIIELAGNYINSYKIEGNNQSQIIQSSGNNNTENNDLSTSIEIIEENENNTVTFTNEINKYQDLSLRKHVVSNDNIDKEFEFSIELFDLKANTRYDTSIGRLISDSDGYIQRDITLKNNDIYKFYNLPVGSSYLIKEKDYSKEGFSVEILTDNEANINDRAIEGSIILDKDVNITYRNIEKTVVSGTKTWIDNGLLHDNSSEVELVLLRSIDDINYEIVSDITPIWERNTFYFTDLDIEDEFGNKYYYKVEEKDIDNYYSIIEYDEENNLFNITNTKDKAKLSIYKTVEGNGADTDRLFKFTITLTNEDGSLVNGTFDDVVFENGIGVIHLKHNEHKDIEIYKGISYTIHEDNEEYDVNMNDIMDVLEDDHYVYNFINSLNDEKEYYGNLNIKKIVSGTNIDSNKEFEFTIELSDKSINGIYGDIEFINGISNITLKHNQVLKANNLPAGIEYKVIEKDYSNESYRTYRENDRGLITVNKTINCLFTNVKDEKPPYEPPKTGVKK